MNTIAKSILIVSQCLVISAFALQASLDPVSGELLKSLEHSPQAAGEMTYRGEVYARETTPETNTVPLFTYERRVRDTGAGLTTAAHITRNPAGEVIISERATFTSAFALKRFEATNGQQGYSGQAVLSDDGQRISFSLLQGGKVTQATEEVSAPVVAGPSLHGFILNQWDTLTTGTAVRVRLIVMDRKETYGFDIRELPRAAGQTSFSVTPSSWLIRWMVAPLIVRFDSANRQLLRYEGVVPPMMSVDGTLKTLDARVDYTMAMPAYR